MMKSVLQTKIKAHRLLTVTLLLFIILGLIVVSPTIFSFITYKLVEHHLEGFVHQLGEEQSIESIRRTISLYGFPRWNKEIEAGAVVEEYGMPLYFLDNASDEWFCLIISAVNDSISTKAIWKRNWSQDIEMFSEPAKKERQERRNNAFAFVISCFLIYQMAVITMFLVVPKIALSAKRRSIPAQVGIGGGLFFLVVVCALALIASILWLTYSAYHSYGNLSDQLVVLCHQVR